MLTDQQIEKLNCVTAERLDYEVFEIDQESVKEFARAIEAEVRKECDAKIAAQVSDLSDYMAAANAEANRVDELTALCKQDEALIRQMLGALTVFGMNYGMGEKPWAIVSAAIAAARARLGEGGV